MVLLPMAYVLFAWTVGWFASAAAAWVMDARLPPSRSLWEGVKRLYWIYEDDIDRRLIKEEFPRAHGGVRRDGIHGGRDFSVLQTVLRS
jgi:hypothetical protein